MPDQNTPTMDDRTLIERAAKAAGMIPAEFAGNASYMAGVLDRWNPLTDDGDIARLEAACRIDIAWRPLGVFASSRSLELDIFERYAAHNGDKQKARRYASTRAAASLAMGE